MSGLYIFLIQEWSSIILRSVFTGKLKNNLSYHAFPSSYSLNSCSLVSLKRWVSRYSLKIAFNFFYTAGKPSFPCLTSYIKRQKSKPNPRYIHGSKYDTDTSSQQHLELLPMRVILSAGSTSLCLSVDLSFGIPSSKHSPKFRYHPVSLGIVTRFVQATNTDCDNNYCNNLG